jgi:catechol 2,3-dioxygenase-like lactoylglutathione lyase family enzyme
MAAKALDHIAITVSNTERSLRFYCDLLGLEQIERHQLDGAKIEKALGIAGARAQSTRLAAKGTPSILIDLMEFRTPTKEPCLAPAGAVGSTHFCLAVEGLSAAYERLRADGVDFVSEPVTFELTEGSVTVVFTHDPDGNIVELVDVTED